VIIEIPALVRVTSSLLPFHSLNLP